MSKTMTTAERVTRIVIQHLGAEPEQVAPTAHVVDDLGADSLDTVELVMAIEDEFGIEIPDRDAEQAQTVADWIALVERLLPARHPATTIGE